MQSNPLLSRGLASRYGRADREVCRLIDAMDEVRNSVGKKTMFGADRHAVASKAFVQQLLTTCSALVLVKELDPASPKARSLSVLNSIMGSYRLAYPDRNDAFLVWEEFFNHQRTLEPTKPWLLQFV